MVLAVLHISFCEASENLSTEQGKGWGHYSKIHHELLYEICLPKRDFFHPSPVFAFSRDRQLGLYSYINIPDESSKIWLIDLQDGQIIGSVPGHPDSNQCIAFSPDGTKAISGGNEGVLCLWDIENFTKIECAKGHKDYIRAAAYSPVEQLALSGGDDRVILLWDLKKMTIQKQFTGHTSGIRNLEWSKDGKTFLSGSWDGSIRLWETHTGKELAHLQAGHGRVMSLALSPDGNYALSSYLSGPDQPVIYWDLREQKEINRFGISGNPWRANKQLHVQDVAFSPDGKTALFGLVFGTAVWWSLEDWKEIAQNHIYEGELGYVAFSEDGKSCISVGVEKSGSEKEPTGKVSVWKLPKTRDSHNPVRPGICSLAISDWKLGTVTYCRLEKLGTVTNKNETPQGQ
jgi:WD40 repeat protein